MEGFLKRYIKGDSTIWIVFIALIVISIIEMYSASSTLAYRASSHTAPMLRHLGFLLGGAGLAIAVHYIPLSFIRLVSYLGLLVSFVMLILVMVKGTTENDATRWLVIAGVQFQPSELAKLSVIIVSADFISRIKNPETDEKKYFWSTIILLAIICPLILLENFSTAILLFLVVFTMMFISRVSFKRLGILAASLMLILFLGYAAVKVVPQEKMPSAFDRAYTWTARIERFTSESGEEEDKYVINDENRQVQHGRIAIARGGVFGVMPGNSVERDYLPQAYSDFIYAIVVEETGLIGGIVVILLYLILLFRAGRIATKSPTVFPAVLVIGLSLMIVVQAFVSMSVATSLGPVTGQPLPLISRGGTSILITSLYFGIIFGVTRQIIGVDKSVVSEMDKKPSDDTEIVQMDDI